MAEIVLGIGTAHGPLLSTPPEKWDLRARADRENKNHWYRGRTYDFESLLRERAPGFGAQTGIETRRERHARCRAALEVLERKVLEAAPEALVILGNDQREYFGEDLTPSITVYRGAEIFNARETHEPAPGLNIAEPGNAPEQGTSYPGATALADHILDCLAEEGFDPAQSNSRPKGASRPGIPHAYGFVYHTILRDNPAPSVPIILNVHFPHNQPKIGRCLALGRTLQRAIRSFQGTRRVALIASGGLTHFVVDEEFDREVLHAIDRGDEDALGRLPENVFKVGTAEIKNWFPVVAAMNAEGRRSHEVDYVPCYRSEAGTGNAMGFVYWE
jgi:Catalytic LigB subunit of aromatic ring-opening dioxygenase